MSNYSFEYHNAIIDVDKVVEDLDSGVFIVTLSSDGNGFQLLQQHLISMMKAIQNKSFINDIVESIDKRDIVIHYKNELYSVAKNAYVYKRSYNAGQWDFYFKCDVYSSDQGFFIGK